jgi:peptide/nickel transport system substrate-binding protein
MKKGGQKMKRRTFKCGFVAFLVWMGITLGFSLSLAGEPEYGGTLRVGVLIPQYKWLDARYQSVAIFSNCAEMIYEGLVQWKKEPYETPAAWLATDYETEDNKVWLFHLRKGVKFHNGREMTAEDVKTNLEWYIETPKGWKPVQNRGAFQDLEKVEVIDKYTLKATMKRPFAPLPRLMAMLQRTIAPPEEIEKWGDEFRLHPVGTGPFKVAEITDVKVVLERFDGYWGPKPYLDRVEYIFIRSDESRLITLQKGEIDLAYVYDDAKPIVEEDPNLGWMTFIIPDSLNKMGFNVRRWPMNDIRFRKAIWMGADWINMSINAHPYKSGTSARTLLDHTRYFNPEALKLVPPYNPGEAKKLIQAVEKDAGKKIPSLYWLDNDAVDRRAMGEMAKVQLAQIGVPLNLQILPRGVFVDKLLRDPKVEFDLGQNGIGFGIEPYRGFAFFMSDSGYGGDGKSLLGSSSPEMDGWINKALKSMNEDERIRCYQEAEKILLRDALLIPWYPTRNSIAYNKKVKGFETTCQGGLVVTRWDWANTWIER